MTEHPTRNVRRLAAASKAARAEAYDLEAEAMKALAHPKRLLVLDLLADGNERSVSELLADAGLSQSNLSQNLAIMRNVGLLATRKEGNVVYYRLADPRVAKAVSLVRAVLDERAADRQLVLERARAESRARSKRAASYALVAFLGLGAVVLVGAFAHPALAGGSLADVAPHAQRMATSPDLTTTIEVCREIMTEPPAAADSMPMKTA